MPAAVAAVPLVAAVVVGIAIAGRNGPSAATTIVPATLPAELTGPAPWPRHVDGLRARLAAMHLPALSQEGTALHIHVHLDVFVDGRRVVVPAGIGIADTFISPLHTHDSTGVVHVESPTIRRFTLGEVLGVWGVRFGTGKLGGYRDGAGRMLRVYVDGRRATGDPRGIALAPHQEIVLAFDARNQLPKPVPDSFEFAPGL
jgi:hypothetical protein